MGPNPYSQIHSASGRARVPFVQQSYPSMIDNSKDKSLHLRRVASLSVVKPPHVPPAVQTIPSAAAVTFWSIGELPKYFLTSRTSAISENDSWMKRPDPPSKAMILPEENPNANADIFAPTKEEPPMSIYPARASNTERRRHSCDPEDGSATPLHRAEQIEPLGKPLSILPKRSNRDAPITLHFLQDVSSSSQVLLRGRRARHRHPNDDNATPSDPPILLVVNADEEDSRRCKSYK